MRKWEPLMCQTNTRPFFKRVASYTVSFFDHAAHPLHGVGRASRRGRVISLVAGCLLPLLAGAEVTLNVGDIKVRGQAVFDNEFSHGYAECRFTVENRSPSQAREVRVDLMGSGNRITKTVTAPPNARLAFSMFVPHSRPYMQMEATVDNRQTKKGGNLFSRSGYGSRKKVSILASKSINQDDLQKRIEELRGWKSANQFKNAYTLCRTDLPPQEWSENWLAYSGFDGIVLKRSDIEPMPPNVLAALQQYVECGGTLSILGSGPCPFAGKTVQQLNPSIYAVGFGRCFVHASNDFSKIKPDEQVWRNVSATFNLDRSENQINKIFPLVDQMSVPVRGFLLLVTVFALIAGPLTVVVLAKTNRRIWLLWMVPLESAIACGLVLGYSFVSEGITPTVRLAGVTLLDQERHVATTLGWAGYYCPQRPAKGLFFPDDWELQKMQHRYQQGATTVDWTRGQHLSRGWVQARVPAFFMCRRSAVRRERLECDFTGEKVEVVNGLGADVRSLWLRDAEGHLHFAENIKAGQRTVLEAKKETTSSTQLEALHRLFKDDFKNAKTRLSQDPQYYLIPGSYIAALDGTPFMEHGLGDKKIKLKASGTVYGILATEEKGN